MAVDLLVVSYNTKDKLIRLLDTLHSDYEPGVWNIYIQDNDSQDGTGEWLLGSESYNYNIAGVHLADNVGYANAINYLGSRCNSEILAAVNADTWFTTNHVKQAIASFDNNPNQAIMGPKQLDEERRIRHGGIFWSGRESGVSPQHRCWNVSDPSDMMIKDRFRCWSVSGSLYYIRRDVWSRLTLCPEYQKITNFAPGAFLPTRHYFEETFCSVHAGQHGYEVWYDGTIETAGHSWHASEPVGSSSAKYFYESQQKYVEACEALGIEHEC